MKFYVYAIISIVGRIYIGQTGNLEVRLKQHNAGRVKSTKSEIPWTFLKTQEFPTREEARFFEWSLKHSKGKRMRWIGYAPEGRFLKKHKDRICKFSLYGARFVKRD